MTLKQFLAIVGVVLFITYLGGQRAAPAANYGYLPRDAVVLYSAAWCGYCTKTRRFLRRNGIPFNELDVETSDEGRRRYDAIGADVLPVVDVSGTIVYGYDPDAIVAALPTR